MERKERDRGAVRVAYTGAHNTRRQKSARNSSKIQLLRCQVDKNESYTEIEKKNAATVHYN